MRPELSERICALEAAGSAFEGQRNAVRGCGHSPGCIGDDRGDREFITGIRELLLICVLRGSDRCRCMVGGVCGPVSAVFLLLWRLCGLPPRVHGSMAGGHIRQGVFAAVGQSHDVQVANAIAI